MSKYGDCNLAESNIGQTINFCSHLQPDELVCIHVPVVFRQFSIKKNTTRNIALSPKRGLLHPCFSFECIKNFHISDIKILSKTVLNEGSALKKNFELSISTKYSILYSDGANQLMQPDEAVFNLTLNNICCPRYSTKCYPKDYPWVFPKAVDEDGVIIDADAFAEELWNMLCPCTGALILDIGVLFLIRFICYKQLVVPIYTHSPSFHKQKDAGQQKFKGGR